jgi:hypothetical protein
LTTETVFAAFGIFIAGRLGADGNPAPHRH